MTLLLDEAHADGGAGRITLGIEARIHLRQQRRVDARECHADRNRHERLLSNGLATRLDAAFIVPFTGSAETGFE